MPDGRESRDQVPELVSVEAQNEVEDPVGAAQSDLPVNDRDHTSGHFEAAHRQGAIANDPDFLDTADDLLEFEADHLGARLLTAIQRHGEIHSEPRGPTQWRDLFEDPQDLSETGWGIIYPLQKVELFKQSLRKLVEHRQSQAGGKFREFVVDSKLTAREFLSINNVAPASTESDKIPYYLLIIGDPVLISFEFQYHLSISHAVGRLSFREFADYEDYAEAVVGVERQGYGRPRRATFFCAENGDVATDRLAKYLIAPLSGRIRTKLPDLSIDERRAENSTKLDLNKLFKRNERPDLLLTGCHGLRLRPSNRDRQEDLQGALICGDWPGYEHGSPMPEHYFCADDLADTRVPGLIVFLLSCYGAGTPRRDNFPYTEASEDCPVTALTPGIIAERAFIAHLPQTLLRRGALAVIGHVDRLWTTSFCWVTENQVVEVIDGFEKTLSRLLGGDRIGHALRSLISRYSELATGLVELQEEIIKGGNVDQKELALRWTAYSDARNLLLLGDPAVYATGSQVNHLKDTPPSLPAYMEPSTPTSLLVPDLLLIVTEKKLQGKTILSYVMQTSQPFRKSIVSFDTEPIDGLGSLSEKWLIDIHRAISEDGSKDRINNLGRDHCEVLMPAEIRTRLWEARSSTKTLHIVSTEAWIPWELMLLQDPSGRSKSEGFLAESFRLTRWLAGHNEVNTFPMTRIGLIVPEDGRLGGAKLEYSEICKYSGTGRIVQPFPTQYAGVVKLLASGQYNGLHFSGHGRPWGNSTRDWDIALDGGKNLTWRDLDGEAGNLGRAQPLVFLNACQTVGNGAAKVGAGGMARSFIEKGAGGFIGTYWRVSDARAAEFSKAFYENFFSGVSISEAIWAARMKIRRDDDFTWLAYTAFAQPFATCPKSPSSRRTLLTVLISSAILVVGLSLYFLTSASSPSSDRAARGGLEVVTNSDFRKFSDNINSVKGYTLAPPECWSDGYPEGKDDDPVCGVSHADAKAYCLSVTGALLSVTEWLSQVDPSTAPRGTDGGYLSEWTSTPHPKKRESFFICTYGSFEAGDCKYSKHGADRHPSITFRCKRKSESSEALE